MALHFNKDDLGDGGGSGFESKPGIYRFKVDTVEENKQFKSGTEGWGIMMLVDAGGKYESKCFDNVVTDAKDTGKSNALWKLEKLYQSVGVPFESPANGWDIEGKMGEAEFVVEEYNGYQNLKVKAYIEPGSKDAPRVNNVTIPLDQEADVPF